MFQMTNFLTIFSTVIVTGELKSRIRSQKIVIQTKKALKRMGIVNNYEDIRNKTVAVVGVGGVGSGKNISHNL